MIELNNNQYLIAEQFIEKIKCEDVYPYSIIEKSQEGRIFVDSLENPQTVLFWHYCGFAYVSGVCENHQFLQELAKLLLRNYEKDQNRFVLGINDEAWNSVISGMMNEYSQIKVRNRFMFHFHSAEDYTRYLRVPEGFNIVETDNENINKLQGKIVPSFSWHTSEEFLTKGKGFCLVDKSNGTIAGNAFSAAIGNKKIDIGIEMNSSYRGRGLGTVVAAHMLRYVFSIGYEPIWGCDINNIGSATIAQKVGFIKAGQHLVYTI